MAAEKRSRTVEGFYRGIKSHVRLKVYDFIITLGIPHSCSTQFCIRIFKTEFVLLLPRSSSSSRSSVSCSGDLQLYNSYRSLLPANI